MAPKRYKDDDSPFTPSGDLEDESTLDEILMDGDDEDDDDKEYEGENFADTELPTDDDDDELLDEEIDEKDIK